MASLGRSMNTIWQVLRTALLSEHARTLSTVLENRARRGEARRHKIGFELYHRQSSVLSSRQRFEPFKENSARQPTRRLPQSRSTQEKCMTEGEHQTRIKENMVLNVDVESEGAGQHLALRQGKVRGPLFLDGFSRM